MQAVTGADGAPAAGRRAPRQSSHSVAPTGHPPTHLVKILDQPCLLALACLIFVPQRLNLLGCGRHQG